MGDTLISEQPDNPMGPSPASSSSIGHSSTRPRPILGGSPDRRGEPRSPLFNVIVHRLSDATRHAGHADILREGLDGAVGVDAGSVPLHGRDNAFWDARRAAIERVAQAANPHSRDIRHRS